MNKFYLLAASGILFLQAALNGQAPSVSSTPGGTAAPGIGEIEIQMGEIIVSSFRINRAIRELPMPLAVAGSYNFLKSSSLTLSNVLANEPGVALGGDGIWSTRINIRGLNENRMVTLVDGNRIETANDLTASLSMIALNDIERVEVIKGAQSSLYGTGAMGGIVNIITKDGYFSNKPYVSGNIQTGYASANNLFTGHGEVTTGSSKWHLRMSSAYNKAGDMNTPEGVLQNSSYSARNIAAKAGFKPFKNHTFRVQYQDYHAADVGIPGGEAFPGPAVAKYTDISRQLLSASYEISNISESFTQLKLNYFVQYIKRDVELLPNTVTVTPLASGFQRTTPELFIPKGNHLTNGAHLQGTWRLTGNSTLIAGIDGWSRKLTTERTKFIRTEIVSNEGVVTRTNNIVRGETPIPESSFSSAGIFFQNETRMLNNRLRIIAGGRFDGAMVNNERGLDVDYLIVNGVRNDNPPNQRITFEKSSESSISWSANFGSIYSILKSADLSMSIARSFRAPSLEERFKYIDLGNFVRLGNPELKPESGLSADLGLRIWKSDFTFQADIFINSIANMIVESPGQFIYTINTGPAAGTTDTLPALINANVSRALLYGFDFGGQYSFCQGFVLFASGAWVRGKDTEAGTSLPQVPPLNGRVGLRYSIPTAGSAEISVSGAAKQNKVAGGEKKTGGYARYDFSVSSAKLKAGKTHLQFFGGIDNFTNRSYTNHLATNRGSISVEPGRNYYLKVNLSF